MTEQGETIQNHVEALLASVRGAERTLPGTPAGDAWRAFLRAHASLMRVLDTELLNGVELSFSDFDVLIQLGTAKGARLRMSELARKALISRSGMTRRAGQLEERGLVARQPDLKDRRSVVITLTDAGAEVLQRALPVHFSGVSTHFLERLTDDELAALQSALEKVVIDCDFG